MMRSILSIFLMFQVLLCSAQFTLEEKANGFQFPVDLVHCGDERLFVVEQPGRIWVLDSTFSKSLFLDIRNRVLSAAGEQGLLGLAFHPDYQDNGYFYVNYIFGSGNGTSRISRFQVNSNDPNQADANSEEIILELIQPATNHNGGDLAFGPDGNLYCGFGDGGSAGDPWGNAQNRLSLHGKLIRISVDGNAPYEIPSDNPFADDDFTLDEIWALGLRNPWRFSFDRHTGDLWIGDVGQNSREEIDYEKYGGQGGINYGWDCREGSLSFNNPASECANLSLEDFVEPVYDYKLATRNSVTGGYVYRGCKYPDLYGTYVYADFENGYFGGIRRDSLGDFQEFTLLEDRTLDISTFGEDQDGELYCIALRSGTIYQIGFGEEVIEPSITQVNDLLTVPDSFLFYQWYRDGVLLPGDTIHNIVPNQNGNYFVEVFYNEGNCSTVSNEFEFVLNNTKFLEEYGELKVYPNPTSGGLHIKLELLSASHCELRILDQHGSVLKQEHWASANTFVKYLDMSDLSEGVYLLVVKSKDGELLREIVLH